MAKELSPSQLIKKAQRKAKRERWQTAFALQLRQAGLPAPTPEYTAFPGHKPTYRWDFAFPEAMILIEIQGGTWMKGQSGHKSGTGIERDCRKSNLANLNSYCQLNFTSNMITDGTALAHTIQALSNFQPFA